MKQLALAVLLTLAIASSVHEDKPDELGLGTLNGQVYEVEESGDFQHASNAQGHLISCEPPKDWHADDVPSACFAFVMQLQAPGFPSYSAALSTLVEYARIHHVRDVPFQADAQGLFSVSAVKGDYLVYADGVVGGRSCTWLLMRPVRLEKRPVSIKLSRPAIVEGYSPPLLTMPSLILRTSEHQ
jgi:hypothetical protein